MELQTEKPVILEWKFANCKPLRTVYLVPLNGDGLLLKDVVHDDFESVTIMSGELVRSPLPKEAVGV